MAVRVHWGSEIWNKAAAFYVRMNVFVVKRSIKLEDEFDDVDEKGVAYLVVYDGKQPIATGRITPMEASGDDSVVRPGRIAVLDEYQGKGFGAMVLREIERFALTQGKTLSCIHSEAVSAGFYTNQGYETVSDIFEEDGVPCVMMQKKLMPVC